MRSIIGSFSKSASQQISMSARGALPLRPDSLARFILQRSSHRLSQHAQLAHQLLKLVEVKRLHGI